MRRKRPMGQVELILQSGPQENAAAALAMVLSYYGKSASLRELTEHPISDAAGLVSAAWERGIHAQGFQMSFEQLRRAPMPLIAHWRFSSFVVVTGIQGGKVYVHSPEEGCRTLTRAEFEAGFTGVAICFAAAEGDRSAPQGPSIRSWLGGNPSTTALLAVAQVFMALCCAALAVLFRSIAHQMSFPQADEGLALCVKIGLAALLFLGAAAFQVWLIRRCRIDRREEEIRQFCADMEGADTAFFKTVSSYRINAAYQGCEEGPAAMARGAVCLTQLVSSAVCLALMVVQNPVVGLAAVVVAAGFVGVCAAGRMELYSDGLLADRDRFLSEETAAFDLARLAEARLRAEEESWFQLWFGRSGGAHRSGGAARQKQLWKIAVAVQIVLTFGVCLWGMIAGWADLADLLGCMGLSVMSAASMSALPGLFLAQMEAKRHWEAVELVRSDIKDASVPGTMTARMDALTVQNVSIPSTEAERPALKGITFSVRRGEVLVVVGDRDVRETLAPVVSGLERPAQGELYLGNRDAADLGEEDVFQAVTLLGQGLPYPNGMVRENIAAGLLNITDYMVMETASDAQLHESILLRHKGYDTPVQSLSKGERVLLEFACAFARQTPFLVADSLTELLDTHTERELLRAVRRRGVGMVLLTGRPSLMGSGDLVCRIEGGRTVLRERGEFVGEVDSLV